MKRKAQRNVGSAKKEIRENPAVDVRLLIDNAPDGIFRLDSSFRYTFINRAMERFACLSREELLGLSLDDCDFLPEDTRSRMKEAVENVFETGATHDLYVSYSTDRRMMYFEIRLAPERDTHDRVVAVIGIARDITDSKSGKDETRWLHGKLEKGARGAMQLENLIVQFSEARKEIESGRDNVLREKSNLEAILKTVPVGVALFDRHGSLVYWNDRALELWGQEPKEKVGTLRYVHELHLTNADGNLFDRLDLPSSRALLKGEEVWGEEVTIERPDGRKLTVLANASPFRESDGPGRVVLAFMDITEIKRSQELDQKLNTINIQLLAGIDNEVNLQYAMTEGAKSLHADAGAISLVMETKEWVVRKVYGFSDDLIGTSMSDKEKHHVMPAIQNGQPVVIEDTLNDKRVDVAHFQEYGIRSVIVVPIIGKKGPIGIIFFNYYSPRRFSLPEVDFCVNLASSISFSIQNNELVNEIKAHSVSLELANRDLEAFSRSISHDLRAPLIVIDGFARRLLEKVGFTPYTKGMTYIENIRESCRHGINLVDDLLNLFKAGRGQASREKVDLTRLMFTISEMVESFKQERKAKISIQDGLVAMGDRRLLTIALQNLFENAWKFTSSVENAIIEFGFDDSGETPAFFIRDNGCGFRKDHADKIFTPFHRAHSHDEYPGTGLGLATVHRIISCHGGHIWTESEPGKGATFYFTLPFTAE